MFLAIGMLVLAIIATPSTASADESKKVREARAHYTTCNKLFKAGSPCKALKACNAGIAAHTTPQLKKLRKKTSAACDAKKKPKRRTRSRRRRGRKSKKCSQGMTISDITNGQCCWPGQSWSEKRCTGTPTKCPEGYHINGNADACEPTPCEGGRVRTPDGKHCCWPSQRWSKSGKRCKGAASCPWGERVSKVECVPLSPCDGGMIRTLDGAHCCWPGQNWSEQHLACLGAPACPPPLQTSGSQCVAAEEVASPIQSASQWNGTSAKKTTGWVLAGTGLALGVVSGGLFYVAKDKRDTAQPGEVNQAEAFALRDEADSLTTAGLVVGALGLGSLVTGGLLVLLANTTTTTEASAALTPLPGGGSISVFWRF